MKPTRRWRDGTMQVDRHERKKGGRAVAHMRDGSVIEITNLVHQVELAESGQVARFERVA